MQQPAIPVHYSVGTPMNVDINKCGAHVCYNYINKFLESLLGAISDIFKLSFRFYI